MNTQHHAKRLRMLETNVALQEGVMRVTVETDVHGSLSAHDAIVPLATFAVILVPYRQTPDEHHSFRRYFWKEVKKLDIHPDLVDLRICEDDRPPFDPPN